MRTYLLTAPRWMVGVFSGLIFGIGMAFIVRGISPPTPSWPATLVICLATGAGFGLTMAFTIGRQRHALLEAAGDLPPAQLLAAVRAAAWGPVPAEPQIRAAAGRVAQSRIVKIRRSRVLLLIVVVLFSALGVINALLGTYPSAALNVLVVLLMGSELYQLKRLPQRIERLSA
jgi:hypothetical protein